MYQCLKICLTLKKATTMAREIFKAGAALALFGVCITHIPLIYNTPPPHDTDFLKHVINTPTTKKIKKMECIVQAPPHNKNTPHQHQFAKHAAILPTLGGTRYSKEPAPEKP